MSVAPPLTVTATCVHAFAASDTGAAAVCAGAPGPAIDAWCGVVPAPGVAAQGAAVVGCSAERDTLLGGAGEPDVVGDRDVV